MNSDVSADRATELIGRVIETSRIRSHGSFTPVDVSSAWRDIHGAAMAMAWACGIADGRRQEPMSSSMSESLAARECYLMLCLASKRSRNTQAALGILEIMDPALQTLLGTGEPSPR